MNEQLFSKLADTGLYAAQLFIELAALFVLISFLVGFLNEWLPPEKTRHYLSARHGHGYLIGALIGSATPFCSCSTVPLTLGLLKSGAGFGPTMTLLFTSPLVNPIIVSLFWITFGLELTLLYALMAVSMAIVISWFIDRLGFERHLKQDLFEKKPVAVKVEFNMKQGESCCSNEPTKSVKSDCCEPGKEKPVEVKLDASGIGLITEKTETLETFSGKAKRLFKEAVGQFRSFLPHVAIGVLIGAFAHGFVPDEWLIKYAGQDNLWAIPLAAIIGVPLYVRGSTMIPIALTLTAKGMGIGAVIALVIGGAGASLPEMIMLKRMFHWPILIAFLLSVFGIAITTGFMAQIFF